MANVTTNRMAELRELSKKVVRRGKCVGCREHVKDGEPIVVCGPRRFLCADCSDVKRPFTCRNCRRVIVGTFAYRVRYPPKSALICADCRNVSKQEGLPSRCRGCLQEIAAGKPLVYCSWCRHVCVPCASAARPVYCNGCHRTIKDDYMHLIKYGGNQRNTVCRWCWADVKTGVRRPRFAAPQRVTA